MRGELTLILETSTPHASVAVVHPDGSLEQREFCSDRSHNAVLFNPLQELLGSGNIGLVIVGSGPGSYSGTRVGIAAAQGVAIASGCPAVALPSILAISAAENGAKCLAIGDARRGSYWTAEVNQLLMTTSPVLTDAAGLQNSVEAAIATGASVVSFEEPSRFPLPQELISRVKLEFPAASRLWNAWSAASVDTRNQWAAEVPQPLYLKPPHITPAKKSWLVQS